MMSRRLLALDRLVTLLLALALLAGGAAAVWWWTGRSGLPGAIDATPAQDLTAAGWWPAAAAAGGLLLALVGLRWLAAHLRRAGVDSLHLHDSDARGRLSVDAGRVAATAAEAYAETPGVRTARGRMVRRRGELVCRVAATIDPEADLDLLARRADDVAADLARVLERPDLRCSVELAVGGPVSRLVQAS